MLVGVLTEAALRILLKDEDLDALKEYCVDAGVIVTPSAKAYLIDHRIDLVVGNKRIIKTPGVEKAGREQTGRGQAARVGEKTEKKEEQAERGQAEGAPAKGEKPEYMTALRGTALVFKDHKIIRLRGQIDSFEAKILETQLAFRRGGLDGAAADLEEVLDLARRILRAEVLNEPMPPLNLFGMDAAELRSRSHFPERYYGVPHFMPITAEDGETVLALNVLRTMSREVEVCAVAAFRNASGAVDREDIVCALNRLSSAVYVMMLRAKAGEYGAGR
jgi:ethanolamine utilization cobalamin adenosyltransferase